MGRYIEWDDVVNRYRQYGDIVGAEESEESFVQYAEAYVEAGLGAAFSVPLEPGNVLVKDLCIDVAFAKTQLFRDTDKATAILDHVASVVEDLVTGKMAMVGSGGVVVAADGQPVYSQTMDYTPVFGMGDIVDAQVDSAQLYDEEQRRG